MDYKIIDESATEGQELPMQGEAVKYLVKSRNWTMFIAIMGFIGLGILLVAAIFLFVAGSFIPAGIGSASPFPLGLLSVVYLIVAVIYFFPVLYLLRFSQYSGKAAQSLDPMQLTHAIKNLSKHFQWIGISIICIIGLYVVGIFGVIIYNVVS